MAAWRVRWPKKGIGPAQAGARLMAGDWRRRGAAALAFGLLACAALSGDLVRATAAEPT